MLHHSAPSHERSCRRRSPRRLPGSGCSAARRAATSPGSSPAAIASSPAASARARKPPSSRIRAAMPLSAATAAKVSGNCRPTRSTLGIHNPSAASGPQSPGGRAKRQIGATFHAASQSSPSAARLAASMRCIQSCHGSTNPRGRPMLTKSPRAGSLPQKPMAAPGSRRDGWRPDHRFGHRNSCSALLANGFCSEPARSSKTAWRSPLRKVS